MKVPLKNEDLEKVIIAKLLVEKEFHKRYTLANLAHQVGTNEFKMKIGFRYLTQKTFHEYLTFIRIEKAKEYLEASDIPIKVIAIRIGLDRTNFAKCFKKLTGTTPTEWRNRTNGETTFEKEY
jgi:AraC-like DNA-binding protein